MQFRHAIVAAILSGLLWVNPVRAAGLNPVTRVVELLQQLSERVERDHKTEQELYENYVCWATSIIGQKKKSNSEARSRSDYLQTYINDLTAGRLDLTTERVDLEKEIESLKGEREVAEARRLAEEQDFKMAKEEMDQAIAALQKAIDVLRVATSNHTSGVLLRLEAGTSAGFEARAKEATALAHAVELGKRVLSKGDALFLSRVLNVDVPERADWKKLNRNATFKMSYKARSFKIQSVLAGLLMTFTSQLGEAASKEKTAVQQYNKLESAKLGELNVAQTALSKMEKETGARAMSLSNANDEKNALDQQIVDDEGFISQVEQALRTKNTEWQDRQTLRTGELAAISKAISILHSDDARDLFKRSHASQGYSFLQESTSNEGAARILLNAARKAGSVRLESLVATVKSNHFADVVIAIDSMLTLLADEEKKDRQTKEKCEADLTTDTRQAMLLSRTIDDNSDRIASLKASIAELMVEIQDREAKIKKNDEDVAAMDAQRNKENAAYLVAKKDDEDAASLVNQARQVLQEFYSTNGLMLVQGRHAHQEPFVSEAGMAPPPPPKTWEGAYKGKTEESTGILAIMGMIHDDIQKDLSAADQAETSAQGLYTTQRKALTDENTALGDEIIAMESDLNGHKTSVQGIEGDQDSKSGELTLLLKKMEDYRAGCDFLTVNFQLRSSNRAIEIDGLQKAKAILLGGRFDELPDPNRELKPGDALLQGHLRAGRKFFHHGKL